MFNKTPIFEPKLPEKEKVSDDDSEVVREKPKTDVTPSQRGKFLGALEGKEKEKKRVKGPVKEGEEESEEKGGDLFALAGTIKTKEKGFSEDSETNEQPDEEEEETLAEAASLAGRPAPLKPTKTVDDKAETSEENEVPIEKISEKKEKVSVEKPEKFKKILEKKEVKTQEKEAVPIIEQPQKISHEAPKVAPLTPAEQLEGIRKAREAMIELINKIVETASTVVSKAQTTMTVSIKYPPLFSGVTLTVTELTTAKGEFNITFTNLSPDARLLIEAQNNQTKIRQALVDRGYMLHTITIEEKPTVKTPTISVEIPQDKRGQEKQESGKEPYPQDE